MKEKLPEWKEWILYSEEDLQSAETLLFTENTFPRNVCYLSQQSVEKALKAIFVFLNISFSRIHDLEALYAKLPNEWKDKLNLEGLSELSEWAVEARYPSDGEPPSEEDANFSVSVARRNLYSIKLLIEEY
ncbi:MAG: HEPN domain-containing protein [Leptospiraceae bacterium]|jgi:HEPN domain-containing protein|nr:HEPN domain-containing protein [Leptospiraceae bacterium]